MRTFGYGSNMLLNKLRINVPSANPITVAHLPCYKFAFNKESRRDGSAKGNIMYTGANNDVVWGVIFEIAANEKQNLDREEGLGHGYNEEIIEVLDETNNPLQAQIYIADISAINNVLLPFDWYRDFVIFGARQHNLPVDYIQFLESLRYTVDSDINRREEKYAILGGHN
jgi:gamma-glutamylcyclotransferase